MIDREGRDRLALGLRRLASGQLTNHEFDDDYFERFFTSAEAGKCECGYSLAGLTSGICPECARATRDAALGEIATFGWTLYSDTRRYRLRGRHKLPRIARAAVARCVLFLGSDLEYIHGAAVRERTVLGRGIRASVVAGTTLLILGCAGLALLSRFGWRFAGTSALAALAGLWILWHPWRPRRAGPIEPLPEEIWPFRAMSDLDETRRRVRFLGGLSGPAPSAVRCVP
jgi:hypothetical protein